MHLLAWFRPFRPRVHHQQIKVGPQDQRARQPSILQVATRTASQTVSSVFGRQGLLGVDKVYFDDLLVVRELFETSLQTYQAYRMTQLLPRLGLIRVYVALLVANCWSVPIVHRVYQDQARKRRMASLLCDALLDVVSSMGVTVLIFITYAPQYTDPAFGFPLTNWFNDQWFTSVYQEFQMMLVVSWGDMASRLVFALGLLLCMVDIKDMLQPYRQRLTSQAAVRVSRVSRFQRTKHLLLHTFAPRLFALWGITILVIHSYAEFKGTDWPCKLELRPWFNTKPACSLVEINCHELGLPGRATSLEAAWTLFDPEFTAHLTIRHCPELVVSPAIQQFRHLTSMKVYNSSIVACSDTAAITSSAHGNLRAMYFIRTTFLNATLPVGLTPKDFPQSFKSFVVSSSNLASLPTDLHQLWPSHMTITLEASQFKEVPETIVTLLPVVFSLAHNPISSISAALFEIPPLQVLIVSYTAIQELPRDVVEPSLELYLVALDGANVSTLWAWMDPVISRAFSYRKQFFSAHGSLFCAERDAIEAGTRSQISAAGSLPLSALASAMDVSTSERLAYSKEAVSCDLGIPSHFPLPLEDSVSALEP